MPLKNKNARSAMKNSEEGTKAIRKKAAEMEAATVLGKQKAAVALSEHDEARKSQKCWRKLY
jgi:hypothetical protein